MTSLVRITLILLFIISLTGTIALLAGQIEPEPGSPEPTNITLNDLYNFITGEATTTHTLAPASSTQASMHTVSEIYVALANLIQVDDLASSSVTYLGVSGADPQPATVDSITKEFVPTSNAGDVVGYTLEDIYDLINSNTRITSPDHSFAPGGTPNSTMYTLEEIYTDLVNLIDPANIKVGASYLGVDGTYVPTFAGGDGSVGDPYQIENCQQLQNVGDYLDQNFVLIDDIDCSDTVNWNGGLGFDPIGFSTGIHSDPPTNPLTGNFDGMGYVINDLYINRPSENFVGVFGATDGSVISKVGLVGNEIIGQHNVGGLVGYLGDTTLSKSYSTGSVTGLTFVGGLLGRVDSSTVENVYSIGNISGSARVGGLIGYTSFSALVNSYSTGDVSDIAVWGEGGGLVGQNSYSSTITSSFSTGVVSGNGSLGGLIGTLDTGTLLNNWWYNNTNTADVGDDGDVNEITLEPVDLSAFYSALHPVYTGSPVWDFATVWNTPSGDLPSLQ